MGYWYRRPHTTLEGFSSPAGKVVSSASPDSLLHAQYTDCIFISSQLGLPSSKPRVGSSRTIPAFIFAEAPHATLKVPEIPPNIMTLQQGHVGARHVRQKHGESRVCKTSTQVSVNQSGVPRHPTLSYHLSEKGRVHFWHQRSLTSLKTRDNRRVLGQSFYHWNHCCFPKRKQTFIFTCLRGRCSSFSPPVRSVCLMQVRSRPSLQEKAALPAAVLSRSLLPPNPRCRPSNSMAESSRPFSPSRCTSSIMSQAPL